MGRGLCHLHLLGVWPQLMTDHRCRELCVIFRPGGSNHWNKLLTSLYTWKKETNKKTPKAKKNPQSKKPQLLHLICCHSFVGFFLSGLPSGLLLIAWHLSMDGPINFINRNISASPPFRLQGACLYSVAISTMLRLLKLELAYITLLL